MGAWRLTLHDMADRPFRSVSVVAVKHRLLEL